MFIGILIGIAIGILLTLGFIMWAFRNVTLF